MGVRHLPPLPRDLEGLVNTLQLRLAELYELEALRFVGTGTPEGNVKAPVGATFQRTDGGTTTTLYVKESGAGKTGWVAK